MLYGQNLINNNSFENYTAPVNCTGGVGGFYNYNNTPVNHVVDYWYPLNSPDFFSSLCNGANNNGSPLNSVGCSQAKQGANYSGFILFAANYDTKEYIYQQLSSPLQAGKIYCLSFYVSRADRTTHAIHSIGAYFSIATPTLYNSYYVNKTPQIINQSGFITDTIGWTQIQGCFTANGGEQYITIGNFNSNVNTDTLFVGSNDPHPGADRYAYYYIDDITLIDQTTVGINELDKNIGIEIYPNPSNGVFEVNCFNAGKYSLQITNALGQIIDTKELQEGANSIDLSAEKEGIYFCHILLNDKIIKTEKLVIIK